MMFYPSKKHSMFEERRAEHTGVFEGETSAPATCTETTMGPIFGNGKNNNNNKEE